MSHKITGPSDHNLRVLARDLWKTKKRIWKKISKKIMGPRQNRVEANLYRINKKTQKGDIIVIPGKILANGNIEHQLTIACLNCSISARKKIESSGTATKIISIEDLLEQNPKGTNVKVFY